MAIYSASGPSSPFGAGQPICEIRAFGTVSTVIKEIGVSLAGVSASAVTVGLGIAGAQGIGPINYLTAITDDMGNSDLASLLVVTSWQSPPTVPTTYFRRLTANGLVVAPLIFRFPRGLGVGPSTSLVLWCIANAGYTAAELWFQFEMGM